MRFLLFLISLLVFIPKSHSQDAFKFDDLPFLGSEVTVSGGAFSPSDVPGLIAWFDASAIGSPTNSNGYLVTNWYNGVVGGFSARNITSGGQPYWTNNVSRLGGHPWLEFSGAQVLSLATSQIYSQSNLYFAVVEFDYIGGNNTISSGTNTNFRNLIRGSTIDRLTIASGSTLQGNNSSIVTQRWYLVECTFTNGGSTILTNGTTYASGNAGVNSLSGLSLGYDQGGVAGYLAGGIAEFLFYNSYVSPANLTAIRNYFTDKYGAYANW